MHRLRSNEDCWCGSGRKLKRCHGDPRAMRRNPVAAGAVSAPRPVPDHIARPPYVLSGGQPVAPNSPQIMTGEMLGRLRAACRIAAEVLLETGGAVAVGVSTEELDAVAHEAYLRRGAYPSTLHYKGYSKSICTSVNEVVCHGIPDSRRLVEGDIVNIDVTAYFEGTHGDTSATFAVGQLNPATDALVATTCEATYRGIAAVRPGGDIADIGRAIEPFASARGYGVVHDYGGHGIGTVFHAAPHVDHTANRDNVMTLVPGLTFTVEPMLTAGNHQHRCWPDAWTEVTIDGLPSAQFEHTVIVTEDGAEILTVTADGSSAVRWPNRP